MGTTHEVSERDIEKYVAQYKSDDPSEKYFTYLGVKLANIICKFPEDNAGKIVLRFGYGNQNARKREKRQRRDRSYVRTDK
ncbi:MAG: hypothetical protein IJL12_03860 [Selenomonadaceae bacterium]|nr:hypothetical protein [Selenomonadaceae bacterium]